MNWIELITKGITEDGIQIVNDSKTPSGEPHVGSLRGVLIHDAIYKAIKVKNIEAKYLFGSDDYDPLDEIPAGEDEHFEQYLGRPLCNVPAPPNSKHSDMAEHYISGFFEIFDLLGVEAQKYRMRDIYRNGDFNESIDSILLNSDKIRDIYKAVSGSIKSENWHPFQPICEQCHKIGTTEVTAYDGKEVTYTCHPNIVSWAKGCGYNGKVDPFDGRGKLPWKLEWVAKWLTFGITIEGAGMDHTTKGGSRDIAVSVLGRVFGKKAPLNIPYGFFLLDGAKMSSSKGIGATAKNISEFLSPEILRYLMLNTQPKRAINFTPNEKNIEKIHNNFDQTRNLAFSPNHEEYKLHRETYLMSDLSKENYVIPNFSLIKTWIQLPHIDIEQQSEKLKGNPLNKIEKIRLQNRIRTAKYWLKYYATEDDKFEIQDNIQSSFYEKLSPLQLGFLKQFVRDIKKIEWESQAIQQQVFDTARLTPIPPKAGFNALYRVFLNKDRGPQVGNLLSCLDITFVSKQLNAITIDLIHFWKASFIETDEFEVHLKTQSDEITSINSDILFQCVKEEMGYGVVEYIIKNKSNKQYLLRVNIIDANINLISQEAFNEQAEIFIKKHFVKDIQK